MRCPVVENAFVWNLKAETNIKYVSYFDIQTQTREKT